MKRVYKYGLGAAAWDNGRTVISVPVGAKFLSFGAQPGHPRDHLVVWMLVDLDAPCVDLPLFVAGTGQDLPEDAGSHLATIQLQYSSPLVLHLFLLRVPELGRFGFHPNPATDFCCEVDALEGMEADVRAGLASREELVKRVAVAMTFQVGGDAFAVRAKGALRRLEDRLILVEQLRTEESSE